jgi:signal peptidase I
VAFLLAAGTVLSALAGQISSLPFALIPLLAGIGIARGRAWSAWGFALYTSVQLIPVAFVLLRSGSRPPGAIGGIVLAAVLIPLFFFAGRSLAAAGERKGRAWPWIAISALTAIPVFFVQAFTIPTGSMEETLLPGDHLLVRRFPKPSPARGDMVVFTYPIDRRQTQVKRVIGAPGDRIRISGKTVYRNGAPLDEPYALHKIDHDDAYRDHFPSQAANPFSAAVGETLRKHVVNGELVVPEGKYFVLGDNRDQSLDSRYWGFVDSGDLIGKPLLIYDSEEQTGGRRVRWNRLFKLL